MYDIAIIGAGPAGSTLARFLADRCRILLLDNGRNKCCGGILAPLAQAMFAQFDLTVPKEILADPQPDSVAVWDINANLVRHYARQYINVNRALFNQWLLSLVPPAVDIQHGERYIRSEPLSDGFTVHFTANGGMRSEKVRYLVGADGAFSTVRREFFPEKNFPKRYVAVQELYPFDNWKRDPINFEKDYTGLFDSEITDFYAWTIPKNDGLLFGAAIPFDEKPRQKFNQLKKKLQQLGLPLNTKEPLYRESGLMFRPLRFNSMIAGSGNVALVGEAAGLISPSSAEGIGPALSSAYILSQSFGNNGLDMEKYQMLLRKLRWKLWMKNVKIPAMFFPPMRKLIMLSGLTAVHR